MPFVFGNTSRDKLKGVHCDMQKVMERAIATSDIDFSILEGVRTPKRQQELYAKGRTVAQLRAKGVPTSVLARPGDRKVTWTLNSKHFISADGTGHAVDIVPYPIDFNNLKKYYRIKDFIMDAAKALKVDIRWGGDWDGDGRTEKGESDFGHFELA